MCHIWCRLLGARVMSLLWCCVVGMNGATTRWVGASDNVPLAARAHPSRGGGGTTARRGPIHIEPIARPTCIVACMLMKPVSRSLLPSQILSAATTSGKVAAASTEWGSGGSGEVNLGGIEAGRAGLRALGPRGAGRPKRHLKGSSILKRQSVLLPRATPRDKSLPDATPRHPRPASLICKSEDQSRSHL